jgi:hypothetical protein
MVEKWLYSFSKNVETKEEETLCDIWNFGYLDIWIFGYLDISALVPFFDTSLT